ncbi:MAG TPA: glycosyltransferase family 39 protein [Bryobacteraceae bacterium]|nr:glycosyltransferase family 39 protein [Bryobacteraceae bacterium]
MRRELLIVALFVLALRLPFLNQAIQGDDIDYLYGAEHAQIEPLHPTHTSYAFLGKVVDMRGHPHPPLNAWFLALLLAVWKDVYEIPFHGAYILFSLIAAISALSLARRFSPRPLAATLLFLVTPAFVINGNSLESDLPFLALWLLSIALFIAAVDRHSMRLLAFAALAMAFAAMAAYQAVILTPILLAYTWPRARKWRAGWIATLTAPAVILLWQFFERLSSGALPAGLLAGYMQTYGWQAFGHKIQNAAALTGHLAWVVFPGLWLPPLLAIPAAVGAAFYDLNPLFWGSIAVGVGILIWCAQHWRDFLAQWVLIFFAAALVMFFAGSARYLLPIALPVAILASRYARRRWLEFGIGAGLVLSLAFAVVNYQHWDGYRQFARQIKSGVESKHVFVNDEWGLRFYLESEGARPLLAGQTIHPGEMVVSSSLAAPVPFTSGGGVMVATADREITSVIPLRLIALHGRSAYSGLMNGLRPFDISLDSMDRVRAEIMVERKPVLSDLPMDAAEAAQQIVSGIYQLEGGAWRWTGQTSVVLLKPPAEPTPLVVQFSIPEQSPVRQISVAVNGQQVASRSFAGPGKYSLASPPVRPDGDSAQVTIAADKSFSVQGDSRQLAIILIRVGFEKP